MSYLIILFYFSSHPTQKERRRPSSCENIFPYDAYIENSYSTFRKCNRPSRTCMVIATNFQEHFNLKKKKRKQEGRRFQGVLYLFNAKWGTPCDRWFPCHLWVSVAGIPWCHWVTFPLEGTTSMHPLSFPTKAVSMRPLRNHPLHALWLQLITGIINRIHVASELLSLGFLGIFERPLPLKEWNPCTLWVFRH